MKIYVKKMKKFCEKLKKNCEKKLNIILKKNEKFL